MIGFGVIYSVTFVKLTAPFLVYYKSYITFTLSGFLFASERGRRPIR